MAECDHNGLHIVMKLSEIKKVHKRDKINKGYKILQWKLYILYNRLKIVQSTVKSHLNITCWTK